MLLNRDFIQSEIHLETDYVHMIISLSTDCEGFNTYSSVMSVFLKTWGEIEGYLSYYSFFCFRDSDHCLYASINDLKTSGTSTYL